MVYAQTRTCSRKWDIMRHWKLIIQYSLEDQVFVLISKKKRTIYLEHFNVPIDQWAEIKEIVQIPRPCQKVQKKAVEHKNDSEANYSWCSWNGMLEPWEENGEARDQNDNKEHIDHNAGKICFDI